MKKPYRFYENGFGYIQLVDLNPGNLPETIELDGQGMIRKEEFHISLVWVGRLSEMVDPENKESIKTEMTEGFEKFTEQKPLDNYELTGELRVVSKDKQKTIIVMTRVPYIDEFFEKLSLKYGVDFPVQPTHITLYTLPPDRIGIGIFSYDELKEWSKPIDIPDLNSVLNPVS